MILLIDIGNTNTVCAIYENHKYLVIKRVELINEIDAIMKSFVKYNITDIAISSVVPNLASIYIHKTNKIFNINPFIVSYKNANLDLLVDSAKEVGADRLCNVKAAISITKRNCLVIDFGTATTYDIINDNQQFIGGAIAPGIDISAEYLIEKAALLKDTILEFPKNIIGKNTKTNIQSGVMYSSLYGIEGMIKKIKDELNDEMVIILTGGFSKLISSKLSFGYRLEPNLTLKGMQVIYKENINE